MAYALALQSATDLKMGPLILIDTLFLSLFTILLQGSALHPILSRCEVTQRPELGGLLNSQQSNMQSMGWF